MHQVCLIFKLNDSQIKKGEEALLLSLSSTPSWLNEYQAIRHSPVSVRTKNHSLIEDFFSKNSETLLCNFK